MDLYGQVSEESSGFQQISGAGGQQEFVLDAYLSKEAKALSAALLLTGTKRYTSQLRWNQTYIKNKESTKGRYYHA